MRQSRRWVSEHIAQLMTRTILVSLFKITHRVNFASTPPDEMTSRSLEGDTRDLLAYEKSNVAVRWNRHASSVAPFPNVRNGVAN